MTTPDNDRTYQDQPAGTTDVDNEDRTAGVGETDRTADRGGADREYADEADRSAYGNADRLEDGERTTDALDRPADDRGQMDDGAPVDDALDGQRGSGADNDNDNDNAPDVSPDDPLVPDDMAVDFKSRWDVIQQGFVDDPRSAVTDADKLVGDVLERLSSTFDQQHQSLEGQWSDGEPSTEDLRGALQRYRAFFDRLLTL